jgi:DNA helicase-2/ATP-dependent DNA helicase PcrA
MGASPQQQAIINHDPGRHGRVLAGPGTGKSWASVALLERLLTERPELHVGMLTFTRAATAELAKKLGDTELATLKNAKPSTIHAFALSLLMSNPLASSLPVPLRIPDSWEREELIYPDLGKRLRTQGHDDVTVWTIKDLESEMAAGWSSLDPDLVTLAEMAPKLRNAFLGLWGLHRRVYGYALLAELPFRAVLAIQDYGVEVENLEFMIVDEYQDLNKTDIELIRLLTVQDVRVLAVGDEDQSIYSRRMAAPQGILDFCNQFEAERDYPLTETRRFGGDLLPAANSLIEMATDRSEKPSLTPHADAPATRFRYLRFDTDEGELEGVARLVGHRINVQGISPSGAAILVRSRDDRWANALAPLLDQHNVPYRSVAWVERALEEREVRRGLALVRLALNDRDSIAWWTLLRLTNGISKDFERYIFDSRQSEDEAFVESLLRLYPDFPDSPGLPSSNKAASLIDETTDLIAGINIEGAELDERNWGGWVLDLLNRENVSDDAVGLLESVGTAIPATDGLRAFLSKLEPTGKDLAAGSSDSVRIMNMGRAKGLTLDTVVLMGVEKGLIPHPRGQYEEERRLLYVALTRAERLCVMTFAKSRSSNLAFLGAPNIGGTRGRSPLITELPEFGWRDGSDWISKFIEEAQED